MSIELNLRLALHQLVEAIEYTPMGVRGIKAMTNARKALEAAQQPATPEPVGYMNDGHLHELAMRRIPYGYVYPEAGAGASTAVYTHPAQSVPDGFALVPIEPTQAMLNVQTWDFSRFYSPREIWAAMLAAKERS